MTVPITALAFSPDGQQVAASGYHEITLWKIGRRDAGQPDRGALPSGSTASATAATASGWPPPAAIPGQYGLARLWAAEPGGGGKPVRDLAESQDVVFAVAFSPDGKKLATAGADRIVRVYEIETGKLLVQIEDHADWIFDIAFSPDGKRLATRQPRQDQQGLRRREEGIARHVHRPRPAGLHRRVHARRQGRRHRRRGQPIRVWTIDGEAKQVREIGGFGGTVFKLRYSPDGKTLAACSGDKTVRLFKADNGAAAPHAPGPQRLGLRGRRSPPTARPSPREAGTARSGSGTWPTASSCGPSSPPRGSSRAPRRPRGEPDLHVNSSAAIRVTRATLESALDCRPAGTDSAGIPRLWYMVASSSCGVTGRSAGAEAWASLAPMTWPPRMPPPASSALQTPGQWSRPPAALSFGVRPNSPVATTSVESSRPRAREVVQERREGPIEGRQQLAGVVVERAEGRGTVAVPGHLVEDRIEHVDRDQAHAGLDQPPGQQAALAEGVPPVGVAKLLALAVEIEGVARRCRDQRLGRGGHGVARSQPWSRNRRARSRAFPGSNPGEPGSSAR